MTVDWRITAAQDAVSVLYNRLRECGVGYEPGAAVDPLGIAGGYCGCKLEYLEDLTDRRALEFLEARWGIDISDEELRDEPLAGGLYVSAGTSHRWIFVEKRDNPKRQRWSVAHELGHLVREVWPQIEHRAASAGDLLSTPGERLLSFARCAAPRKLMDGRTSSDGPPQKEWARLKKELDANDFAAALLMPYEGVKAVLGQAGGGQGVRTSAEMGVLVSRLAAQYDVSREAAERRLRNDLKLRSMSENPNGDLFAGL